VNESNTLSCAYMCLHTAFISTVVEGLDAAFLGTLAEFAGCRSGGVGP
jgi:hypothetical protein